jgi:hypothetical protein
MYINRIILFSALHRGDPATPDLSGLLNQIGTNVDQNLRPA